MRLGFIIDLNRCTGCHACILACQIENDGIQEVVWRSVYTQNEDRLPGIPALHLSMACNHCELAPCKTACPAEAFSRDTETGAILHHDQACIGCKYCTWACPYEAPKYNVNKKVIEKCTFCQSRLENSLKPACAEMCPTGALDYGPLEEYGNAAPGFTDHGIRPAVKITPLRRANGPELHIRQRTWPPSTKTEKKISISFAKEWPLALLTYIATLMFGMITGELAGTRLTPDWVFPVAGLTGLALSTFHLGKKTLAWRALLHIKDSWLSREIVFFGLFLITGSYYFLFTGSHGTGWAALVGGIVLLYCIDRVYDPVRTSPNRFMHSADTILTGGLFAALFLENHVLIVLMLLLKLIFFLNRKYIAKKAERHISLTGMFRLVAGIIIPAAIIFLPFTYNFEILLLLILAGEAIDRIDFYNELVIKNPLAAN